MVQPASEGDPLFVFEVCENCHQHQWNTRHKSEKYKAYFEEISAAIKEEIPNAECCHNYLPNGWAGKGPDDFSIKPRLGAFEVIAQVGNTHIVLFSKLKSLVWPDARLFGSTVRRFAEQRDKLSIEELINKFQAKDKVERVSRFNRGRALLDRSSLSNVRS